MCALSFYACLYVVATKHYCLSAAELRNYRNPDGDLNYDKVEDLGDVSIHSMEFKTTIPPTLSTIHPKILEKQREAYIRRPDLVTGILYPVGYYIGFPGIKVNI